jgi:hypothetical protein
VNPEEIITDDLYEAFAEEAASKESEVLGWADNLIAVGSKAAADALSEGFKAKVPLAGGAIGSAINTAITQMDVEAEGGLKTAFDSIIAQAKAKSLGK